MQQIYRITPMSKCDFNNVFTFSQTGHIICSGLLPWYSTKRQKQPPEVFSGKGVLKICSKFTGKYPCQSVISIKLQSNFIEITLQHECSPVKLLHIFRTPFPKNTYRGLLLILKWCNRIWTQFFFQQSYSIKVLEPLGQYNHVKNINMINWNELMYLVYMKRQWQILVFPKDPRVKSSLFSNQVFLFI